VPPEPYPRDLVGYGYAPNGSHGSGASRASAWPNAARIAISVVVNWEEGGENNPLHGDALSEFEGSDVIGARPDQTRDLRVESMFEYGTRAGLWRIARALESAGVPATVFAVGMAVERYPDAARRLVGLGHELCAHGYRWIDYRRVPPDVEGEHIRLAIAAIERATGERPVGWYTGRTSENTRRLVVEEGGFLYDSDSYSDDLPYWEAVSGTPHLVVPYAFDTNDMRFVSTAGFASGRDFFDYLCDSFDTLYAEGATAPKMMSIGLHARVAGRPGRTKALADFLQYARGHDGVWFARRRDIAEYWARAHPPAGLATTGADAATTSVVASATGTATAI
jgi:putative urate catabolism protein